MENGEKSTVVLVPCDSYEDEKVFAAVRRGTEALGGIGALVRPEEKILVKPNFLSVSDIDTACTTHPAVIRAVLRLLQAQGCTQVSYGDSPARGTSKAAAARIGLSPENTYGAALAPMDKEVHVDFPEGMTAKEFYFASDVLASEAIINVCKMKTHALQKLTGAVKNTFGLICGMRKAAMHVKYPNAGEFARALVDIQRCKPCRLHIMDGIVAMEGNGPGNGDPVAMNLLLISTDPVALDTVFARLVGCDPALIPTNVAGASMGLGNTDEEKITLLAAPEGQEVRELTLAEAFTAYGNGHFKMDRSQPILAAARFSLSFLSRFTRRPAIDPKKCVKCGVCVSHCPVEGGAVTFAKGKQHVPVYDYTKCVRCYCCQEICPERAIHVKKGI